MSEDFLQTRSFIFYFKFFFSIDIFYTEITVKIIIN